MIFFRLFIHLNEKKFKNYKIMTKNKIMIKNYDKKLNKKLQKIKDTKITFRIISLQEQG